MTLAVARMQSNKNGWSDKHFPYPDIDKYLYMLLLKHVSQVVKYEVCQGILLESLPIWSLRNSISKNVQDVTNDWSFCVFFIGCGLGGEQNPVVPCWLQPCDTIVKQSEVSSIQASVHKLTLINTGPIWDVVAPT